LPPFAIFTSEFDFLKRDSLALADRGRKVGKLLDMSIVPGAGHANMNENPVSSEPTK